jgi:membrane dipeptidase
MTQPLDRREFVRNAVLAAAIPASPAAAVAPSQSAMALHRSTLVVNGLDPSALRAEYLDLLAAGGVSCWHCDAGDLSEFSQILQFCDQHRARVAPARSVREIRKLHAEGRLSLIFGWQSANVLLPPSEMEAPVIGQLRGYRELGLGICGIAYNVPNRFGGGGMKPDTGLTDAGRKLVQEIHRQRIVLDVGGHTGERTSFDALAMSSGVPVICSHTNVKALNDNYRCMSDRLIEAIARTGGVIGVTAFNDFHVRTAKDASVPRSPQVGLDRHLDQYDYLKKLVGVDHIGLGPDFIEGRNRPGRLSPETREVMVPEAYSQQLPWLYVKGFENIGELPNVTQGLRDRGWTAPELRKLLGENWLRVYEKAWGA